MTHGTGPQSTRELLAEAEARLGSAFRTSSAALAHAGEKGEARVVALRRFLSDQLPGRYAVASGEIFDADGNRSGQTDVVVYDSVNTRPFFTDNGVVLLPAEALLATVEVKTLLSKQEVEKSVRGIAKIHALRPSDAPWAVAEAGRGQSTHSAPRVFTTVFAYDSDLVEESWAASETQRIRDVCIAEGVPAQHVDRVVVLERGVILPAPGQVVAPEGATGALGVWFFQLANFLSREVSRREPFGWDRYRSQTTERWSTVAPRLQDAPPAKRATEADRLKAKNKRNKRAKA